MYLKSEIDYLMLFKVLFYFMRVIVSAPYPITSNILEICDVSALGIHRCVFVKMIILSE